MFKYSSFYKGIEESKRKQKNSYFLLFSFYSVVLLFIIYLGFASCWAWVVFCCNVCACLATSILWVRVKGGRMYWGEGPPVQKFGNKSDKVDFWSLKILYCPPLAPPSLFILAFVHIIVRAKVKRWWGMKNKVSVYICLC